jgi:hypothetical protein
MNKAVAWANQALDYALYVQSPYVAVAYMKPPIIDPYQSSRWIVMPMPTRHDLDQWYQGLVGTPERYHYLAAYDKNTPEWSGGSAIAAVATDADHRVGAPLGIEAYRADALNKAYRFAHESFEHDISFSWVIYLLRGPLGSNNWSMGTSNDLAGSKILIDESISYRPARYWAVIQWDGQNMRVVEDKLIETPSVGVHLSPEAYRPAAMHAVARRAQPNDARTWLYLSLASGNAVTKPLDDYASAMNALGSYFSSAASGTMPDVSYWAVLVLGPSGPEILHDAALSQSASVGAVPMDDQLRHLDQLVALHETFWTALAQQHPTPQMHDFLRRYWDPWLTQWWSYRPYLDTEEGRLSLTNWLAQRGKTGDVVARIVHGGARGLTELREFAAFNGIHTPDLGTTQHGFIYPELPHVADIHSTAQAAS